MTLKAFHILFISLSAILACGFAWWCFTPSPAGTDTARLVLGSLSLLGGLALIGYEVLFVRKLSRIRTP